MRRTAEERREVKGLEKAVKRGPSYRMAGGVYCIVTRYPVPPGSLVGEYYTGRMVQRKDGEYLSQAVRVGQKQIRQVKCKSCGNDYHHPASRLCWSCGNEIASVSRSHFRKFIS